jgi:uncharacterized membrane protein
MKALRSALAIATLALIVGLSPTAEAQLKPSGPGGGPGGPGGPGGGPGGGPPTPGGAPGAQGDQFVFKVCNRSKIPLFVGMLFKTGENTWRALGWVSYKPGTCGPVKGTFSRNDFYWYAEDGPGNVVYAGKDAYACINSADGFDRTISGDYQCAPNEKVVGFTKIDDTTARDGITLTD